MTDKEIKQVARLRVASNCGDCVALVVFLCAVLSLVFLFEMLCYFALKTVNLSYLYNLGLFFANRKVMAFWILKTIPELLFVTPEVNFVRRLFINIARGEDLADTKEYINYHTTSYCKKACLSSFIHNLIKLFAMVPGFIGVYGIYFWGMRSQINELTSWGLFGLTLSVGYTAVWAGIVGHYYISLALTPYIMALNPRTNVFDACDLSVRLMEGKHYRYLKFLAGFIKYLPTLFIVYPVFALYPYFKVCYSLFIDELLGDYKHDKMPGMIKRWRKYQ